MRKKDILLSLLQGTVAPQIIWNSSACEICYFFNLFIYAIIYLYHFKLMDIYFILRVIIQYYIIYFVAYVFPALVIRRYFIWLCFPLPYALRYGVCFVLFLTLWHSRIFQTRLVLFSGSVLRLVIFPSTLCSFYQKMVLQTKIRV